MGILKMDQSEREMDHKEPLIELPGKEVFKALFKIDHDPKVCRRKVDEYTKYGKVEGIIEKLKSHKNNGLNEEKEKDFEWRRKTWGSNKKKKKKIFKGEKKIGGEKKKKKKKKKKK